VFQMQCLESLGISGVSSITMISECSGSGCHVRKFKSVNSNILSRTVSLQVPLYLVRSEMSKDGDDGDGVPDSV